MLETISSNWRVTCIYYFGAPCPVYVTVLELYFDFKNFCNSKLILKSGGIGVLSGSNHNNKLAINKDQRNPPQQNGIHLLVI